MYQEHPNIHSEPWPKYLLARRTPNEEVLKDEAIARIIMLLFSLLFGGSGVWLDTTP